MISLVDITPTNRDKCISLSVAPEQKNFVAANIDSLTEAKNEPGMHPIGISKDGELVGFAMYGYDSETNKSWIIRFMIDTYYQRKRFGTEALNMLIQLLSDKHAGSDIRLCVEPENVGGIKFYESFGFQSTGEKWGNEIIYELKSQNHI